MAKAGKSSENINRRQFGAIIGGCITFPFLVSDFSLAANPTGKKLHGLSAFGELKYPPDFKQFDYANPQAPQGGTFSFSPSNWVLNQNIQTFNTLNSFVLKGDAPPRMGLCFDALMTRSADEPDALYCALAKTVEILPDRNSYRFELRPEAHYHDGSPITAKDVRFSYLTLKKEGHPVFAIALAELDDLVIVDDHTIEMRFSGKQTDRTILSAVDVPILSSAFYTDLKFSDHTMEVPLGSGAWKVGRFEAGQFIEYERVRDYWAKDLGFARGFNHFDILRIDFFLERQAAFEAFKKGSIR